MTQIISTNMLRAFGAGFVTVALAFTMFATPARAQTTAELQAQLQSLLAQIAVLQAQLGMTVTAGTAAFTQDMTIGSTGVQVTALQNFLIGRGFAIPAGATGYFGVQTQSALAAFQAANGIAPAAGYFGPITRAKANALSGGSIGTSVPTPSTPSSPNIPRGSDEGYLDDFEQLSFLSNEEVGESEEDAEVIGLELKARDADQTIERVTVVIDAPTGNDDLEDFITEVSLFLDGDKLDSMDVDDASYSRSSDSYTFRFTGLKGKIEEGQTAELTVAVTGADNVDSGDEGDGWTVRIPANSIRAVSPNGVDDTYDGSSYSTTFTVESFATANNVELNLALNDDNPEEGAAIVNSASDMVLLLAFDMRAEGSDIEIIDLPVDLVSDGADVEDIISRLELRVGSNSYTESVANGNSTTQTVVFDGVNVEVRENNEVEVKVYGRSATDSPIAGASLLASVDPDDIEAEDQSGEDLSAANLTGLANGRDQHFFEVAPDVEVISASISPIDNESGQSPEAATAKIKIKLTARGGAIYLNGDSEATAAREALLVSVIGGNASTTIDTWVHSVSGNYTTTNIDADDEYYTVQEGRSVTIELTGIVEQAIVSPETVLAGMRLSAVQFGTDSSSDVTRSAYTIDWARLMDEMRTGFTPLRNPS